MPSIIPSNGPGYSWSSFFGDLVGSASTLELCSQAAVRAAEVTAEKHGDTCPPCPAQPTSSSSLLDRLPAAIFAHDAHQHLYQLSLAFLSGIAFWVVWDILVLLKLAGRNFVADLQNKISSPTLVRFAGPRGQARLSVTGRHSSGD